MSVRPIFELELRQDEDDLAWELELRDFGMDKESIRDRLRASTIHVMWQGHIIAVAEARVITIVEGDASGWGNADHCTVLKLSERRDHEVWERVPWRNVSVGSVFFVWGHYLEPWGARGGEDHMPATWQELETAWDTGVIDIFYADDGRRIVR